MGGEEGGGGGEGGNCLSLNNTGCFVLFCQPLDEVISRVERGYRMECPEGCPAAVFTIMKECWDLNPDRRPTFGEIQRRLGKILSEFL